MKTITSKFFAENPNRLGHLTVNRGRHRAVINYLNTSQSPYIKVDLGSISEHECLTILGNIHTEEYITKARMSDAYSSAVEYLKIIKHGVSILPEENVFCIGYPGGHHAERDWIPGKGFCVFANVAFAAVLMRQIYGRVLIIDFDLHQGNGTKDVLKDIDDVLVISFHATGIYPLYDVREDTPQKNYIGIPITSGDTAFEDTILRIITETMDSFSPSCLVISAGFDAHASDQFSTLAFTEKTYIAIGKSIAGCHLPTFAVLEGGYNHKTLGRLITSFMGAFD
jgi:acetoin utilization deacetylase AcuC-like enzyme